MTGIIVATSIDAGVAALRDVPISPNAPIWWAATLPSQDGIRLVVTLESDVPAVAT
jgi:hypothetical protein